MCHFVSISWAMRYINMRILFEQSTWNWEMKFPRTEQLGLDLWVDSPMEDNPIPNLNLHANTPEYYENPSIKPLIQHVQQTQYPLKENKTITGAGTQVGGIRIEQNHFLVGWEFICGCLGSPSTCWKATSRSRFLSISRDGVVKVLAKTISKNFSRKMKSPVPQRE